MCRSFLLLLLGLCVIGSMCTHQIPGRRKKPKKSDTITKFPMPDVTDKTSPTPETNPEPETTEETTSTSTTSAVTSTTTSKTTQSETTTEAEPSVEPEVTAETTQGTIPPTTERLQAVYVSKFAERVIDVSSEYGDMWSADDILGKPDIYPRYGDFPGAWQQLEAFSKKEEWIIVQIDEYLFIEKVALYETYNSGRVTKIAISSPYGCWFTAWTKRIPEFLDQSRKFEPSFQNYPYFLSNTVMITTKPAGAGWVNIDSVEVTGELVDLNPMTSLSEFRSKARAKARSL